MNGQKAAFAHLSQLKIPDDFERLVEIHQEIKEKVPPVLFLNCEGDPHFQLEAQAKATEILSKLNDDDEKENGDGRLSSDAGANYMREYYADNEHGFAVRGDTSREHVKEAKEDAFQKASEWFQG